MLLNSNPEAILSCLLLRDEAVWLQQRSKAEEVKDFESAFDLLISKLSGLSFNCIITCF